MRPLRTYLLISHRQRPGPKFRDQAGFGCGAIVAVLLVVLVLAGAAAYTSLTAGLPNPQRLVVQLDPRQGILLQPTRFYDRSGKHLIYTLENPGIPRHYLFLDPGNPDHFSTLLVQLIIAVDDPTFWTHAGVTRASLLAAEPQTLAERLADRLLVDEEPAGLRRSLRARLLALQITARYGRGQVLEWYLNSAYFGHLAFGVDSAARLYLNKSARDLNLAEAALLAAAEHAPALNPLDAPVAALELQKNVLDRLIEDGLISNSDYLTARSAQLGLHPPLEAASPEAPAFSRLVLNDLAERFGSQRLERGGLRVVTSLDYDLQLELNCTLRAQLARLQEQPADPNRRDGGFCQASRLLPPLSPGLAVQPAGLQSSALLLDLQSGEVLAYVGDLSLAHEAEFSSGHAPGSLLSPFVALAGFARGFGPASLLWDIPASLPESLQNQQNPDGKYHGPVRLRTALANDYLAPLAQLLAQVGPDSVWRLTEPLGLRGLERVEQPLDLLYGGGSAAMLDLAQAYATLARMGEQVGVRGAGGERLGPGLVRTVQSIDGQIWLDTQPVETQPVLSAPLAYLVHDILSDETARQPSLGYPNALDTGRPTGAKVGQADAGQQVWTVGYTPQRLVLTWLGGSGTALDVRDAAGVWYALMQYASRDLPPAGWDEPPGLSRINVCNPSGQLPTAACPNVVSELFLNGSEPVEMDSLYRAVQVNRQTGRLATVYTPPALVESRTYLVPPPEALIWAQSAGLPLAPSDYDLIQAPAALPGTQINDPALFHSVHGVVSVRGSAAGEGFEGYRLLVGEGLNPQTWLQIGQERSDPVTDGVLGEWNTGGLDGLYALRLQVIRSGSRVETATVQVTVDNSPPQVRLFYPTQGQEIVSGGGETVTFQARVADNLEIARVVWLVDGLEVGEIAQAPYSYAWRAEIGRHRVLVRAYDRAGNQTDSETIEFDVR